MTKPKDPRTRIENRLLRALPKKEYERLVAHLEQVPCFSQKCSMSRVILSNMSISPMLESYLCFPLSKIARPLK